MNFKFESAMKALTLWLPALLISGCAALPSQVKFPEGSAKLKPADALQADVEDSAIPRITSAEFGANQAELFARTWRQADRHLLLERDVLNNGQFGMVVSGAYNTVKGNLTAAKWALAGAGGTGLVLDRYQVEAQALAYRQGAQSMDCVRREIEAVPKSIWGQFVSGDFAMNADKLNDAIGEDKAKDAYDALSRLLVDIHDVLSEIANKVYENVSSKAVRIPKADDIVNAVKDQQLSQADTKLKAAAFAQARAGGTDSLERIRRLQASVDENQRAMGPLQAEVQRFQTRDADAVALASGTVVPKAGKPISAELKQRVDAYVRLQEELRAKVTYHQELTRQLQAVSGGLTPLVTAARGKAFPSTNAIEAALRLPGQMKTCVKAEVP
ncbi:hypothetical protein [Ideonella sp. YS5]|uniref:hypothetical protein n=1 Tax=Ideonella sp. YS5 TaxID=3453714 RepID=UPI003EEC57D9